MRGGAGLLALALGRGRSTGMSPWWGWLCVASVVCKGPDLCSALCQAGIPGQEGRGNDPESVRLRGWGRLWGRKSHWACGGKTAGGGPCQRLPRARELPILGNSERAT